MREIPLTQGKVALVDDADYAWLSQWKWYADRHKRIYYACRRIKGKTVAMHREILCAKQGEVVDHKDCNGLNNMRDNLRLCSMRNNACNRRKTESSTSQYKGVYWYKRLGKWRAQIQPKGKLILLGYFESEQVAAKAYDIAAKELFGEFAHLNFPCAQ